MADGFEVVSKWLRSGSEVVAKWFDWMRSNST